MAKTPHSPSVKKDFFDDKDMSVTQKTLKQVGMLTNGKVSPQDYEKYMTKKSSRKPARLKK